MAFDWKWENLFAICRRLWYRNQAVNNEARWPRTSHQWDTGTITAATATTLTDSIKTWEANRWSDWSGGGPAFYDVIVDLSGSNDDPYQFVHLGISANTSDTLTIGVIAQWITFGHIDSASDLVGKHYYIISKSTTGGSGFGYDGLWWHERIPIWPRHSRFSGTVEALDTDATYRIITDAGSRRGSTDWSDGAWIGFDLLYTSSGELVRVAIADSDATRLFIPLASPEPGIDTEFNIVASGALWHPGPNHPMWVWSRSEPEFVETHLPDHSLGGTLSPVEDTVLALGEDPVQLFDNDLWTDIDADLDDPPLPPDKSYNPKLYKSPRGAQIGTEGFVVNFVYMRSYEAYEGDIRTMVKAEGWQAAGINSHTFGVTAEEDEEIETSVILLGTGNGFTVPVDYAIFSHDNVLLTSGTTELTEDGHLVGVNGDDDWYFDGGSPSGILSPGWTRYIPRRFRYMYDKTCWTRANDDAPLIPEEDDEEDNNRTGNWSTRPKSTRYAEYDRRGHRPSPFSPNSDGPDAISIEP
jgi:hypothetical protein